MGLPFLFLTSTLQDWGVCIQCFIDRCNVDVMTRVDLNQNHPATAREEQCDCDDAHLVPTLVTSQYFRPFQIFDPLMFVHICIFLDSVRGVAEAEVKWGLAGVTRISLDVQVWNVDADAIAAPGLMLRCSRQSSPAEEIFWWHSFLDKATPGWHTAVMVGWYSTVQYSTVQYTVSRPWEHSDLCR